VHVLKVKNTAILSHTHRLI